ncbi:MAG: hypothetical protein WCJ35_24285 [Planctomycetota bacterium]
MVNAVESTRKSDGKFAVGNRCAAVHGANRRGLALLVFGVYTPERVEPALENILTIACDPARPALAIKAMELISKLVGIQQTTIELLTADEHSTPEQRVTRLRERMAELLCAPSAVPMIYSHE